MIRQAFLAAAAVLALAGSANAFTYFTIGATTGPAPGDPGLSIYETPVVTFDAPNVGVTETNSGAVAVYSASVPGVAAAPAGDTTKFEAIGTGGEAVFDFTGYLAGHTVNTVSVYLGSIDPYNTIFVLNRQDAVIGAITGNDLPAATGDQGASITNRRLYITNLGPDFGGLAFASSGVAFEYDTIGATAANWSPSTPSTPGQLPPPSTVPEPAAWALMLAGFGLMGAALRRRPASAALA